MKTTLYSRLALGSLILGFSAVTSAAHAGPGKITGPHVDKGASEIELTGTYAFNYDNDDYEFENELEYEYGVTDKLLVETEVEFKKENDHDTVTDGVAVGFRYELGEVGEYFVDTAVGAKYKFSGTGGSDRLDLNLALEKTLQSYKFRSNVQARHQVGAHSADGVDMRFSLGGYNKLYGLDAGIEYFADIGNLSGQSGYSAQKHYVGPIIGSEVYLPNNVEFEYKIGYYQGVSSAADDGTIKYEIELEF